MKKDNLDKLKKNVDPELNLINEEEDNHTKKLNDKHNENKLFELDRESSISKHKHKVFIISIYMIWGFIIISIVIRLCHLLAPSKYHWMSSDQIQTLDNFLFSGVIGSIIGKYGNKLLD